MYIPIFRHYREEREKIRERELELKLRKATAERGGFCLKFTPTNWVGAPDRLVVLPGGKLGFVEVKAPGQRARPLQMARHRQLQKLGCYVAVLDDPNKISAILDAIEQHNPVQESERGDPSAGEG